MTQINEEYEKKKIVLKIFLIVQLLKSILNNKTKQFTFLNEI